MNELIILEDKEFIIKDYESFVTCSHRTGHVIYSPMFIYDELETLIIHLYVRKNKYYPLWDSKEELLEAIKNKNYTIDDLKNHKCTDLCKN